MIKKDGTFYLKNSEKENLPTEIDPSITSLPVAEGDTYYVGDTGEIGVFLDGEWVTTGSSSSSDDVNEET